MLELPSIDDLIASVQKCRKEKVLVLAKKLHSQIRELGLDTHDSIGNYLVPMFVECGSLSHAQQAFDRLPHQNEHSWTSLISGYVEYGQVQHAVDMYQKMQEGFVYPSCYTIMALIKAYAKLNDVERAQELHAQAVNNGFDRDVFIGSRLVHMYATCGLLKDAQQVFDKLTFRSTISWTAIISGYAEYGPADTAFTFYEQMQLDGLLLDASTFVCILKACGNIGSLCTGRELHASIVIKGLDDNAFIGNSLVDMYAKCGALAEARILSNKLPTRNLVSWTALIAGYAEHGPGEEALDCLEKMKSEGILPDAVTFASVLKACGSIGAIQRGREIHNDIPQRDLEQFFFVGNAVVDMYVKCGSLEEAQEVFNKLQQRGCAPWNALIAGYAECGASEQVLKCIEHMEQEGIFVDTGTYVSMLKSCGITRSLDEGRELHASIISKGFEVDLSVGNTLIDMYVKKGAVVEAHQVFNKLPAQDVVSWTALIAGYAEGGCGDTVIDCFVQMQVKGVSPNSVTLVCVLKSCSSIGAFGKGQEIHADVVQRGFEKEVSICNTLIDMYANSGSLLEAHDIFGKMPVQGLVSWNAMIKAYGLNHDGEKAVHCFEEMQGHGVIPDEVTFTCILFACSRAKLLRKGQAIFNMMREKYGIRPTIDHYTCMVDLHAKSGCLSDVEGFLHSGLSPSLWTALLTACKIHGEIGLGHRCFEELVRMNPEEATPYVLMAKTYEGVGMWEEAQQIEELRRQAGAKKTAATALIEVNKEVHEFVVGDDLSDEVSKMLNILSSRLRKEGHVPTANEHLAMV